MALTFFRRVPREIQERLLVTSGDNAAPAKSQEDAELLAMADYRAVAGRVVSVAILYGYKGEEDSGDQVELPGPFRVRVTKTSESEIKHWNDAYLDPYWNVEPIPSIPGVRSCFCYGKSYKVE